jgi:hypothetical protein
MCLVSFQLRLLLLAAAVVAPPVGHSQVSWDDSRLKPYVIDHRAAAPGSPADLSFLHDAPAGKDGYIRIQGGHLVKPNGQRIRFWGVHLTDWSRGSVELPPKEDTPMWAATLARYGVNLVRLHFIDAMAPRGIVDSTKNDSRSFDPQQLDRLDFLVAELKKRGIYLDLNLNVGRSYKAGDGVAGFDQIQWAKGMTLFDPRLIELQKEYAKNLLTHVNPYTGAEYRNEPAIALVEIVNENGIGLGFSSPRAPFYDEELTGQYNAWLKQKYSAVQLQQLREGAGVAADAPIPRLKGNQAATAPKVQYNAEMAFFMDLEDGFYQDMSRYLRGLGVRQPIIGTADHGHSGPSFSMLTSLSKLDILDGHIYWNQYVGVYNQPMVNDPLHSTVVQLSRTAFAGKPYTVSETNHPFPNEYASEGIPILAAYGAFQDWDMIVQYTFEPKKDPSWKPYVGDPFDISLDPVRTSELAAGALMFLRGDVHAARETVARTYSHEQVLEARFLPRTEQPYFTPGFPLSLPLEHEVRIQSLSGPPTEKVAAADGNPIVSDTKELSWYTSEAKTGLVTVETDRTQALIGFVKANHKTLKNLGAEITNDFATIVLASMDDQPLARSGKMLLTTGSRVANTGQKWNAARTNLTNQGGSPTLIEPVTGVVVLRNLTGAKTVRVVALDGSGKPIGDPISGKKTAAGWEISVGEPVTTWYVVTVTR